MRYGNLNAKQNVKLVMMDAAGRDILSLERAEDGKFVKADIFDRPVSFSVESHANVGSPEEALSASLNKFGRINLAYMTEITDTTEEELLNALKGRIFYNPLVTGYEIKTASLRERDRESGTHRGMDGRQSRKRAYAGSEAGVGGFEGSRFRSVSPLRTSTSTSGNAGFRRACMPPT